MTSKELGNDIESETVNNLRKLREASTISNTELIEASKKILIDMGVSNMASQEIAENFLSTIRKSK